MPGVSVEKLIAQFKSIRRGSDSPKVNYPKSLRDRVVRYAQSNPNLKAAELATQLGISSSSIRKWCLTSESDEVRGQVKMQPLDVGSPAKKVSFSRPTISTQIHEVTLRFPDGINLESLQMLLKQLEGGRLV